MEETKKCIRCGIVKSLNDYYLNATGYFRSNCIPCNKQYTIDYIKRTKWQANNANYKAYKKEYDRKRWLKLKALKT